MVMNLEAKVKTISIRKQRISVTMQPCNTLYEKVTFLEEIINTVFE